MSIAASGKGFLVWWLLLLAPGVCTVGGLFTVQHDLHYLYPSLAKDVLYSPSVGKMRNNFVYVPRCCRIYRSAPGSGPAQNVNYIFTRARPLPPLLITQVY